MLQSERALTSNDTNLPEIRVAVFADHAPQQLSKVLASAIAETGLFPRMYVADYGTASFQVFDQESE
ncbi:hypothetical protein WDZ92_44265, partial [Nostoc sp. NIES-2111]